MLWAPLSTCRRVPQIVKEKRVVTLHFTLQRSNGAIRITMHFFFIFDSPLLYEGRAEASALAHQSQPRERDFRHPGKRRASRLVGFQQLKSHNSITQQGSFNRLQFPLLWWNIRAFRSCWWVFVSNAVCSLVRLAWTIPVHRERAERWDYESYKATRDFAVCFFFYLLLLIPSKTDLPEREREAIKMYAYLFYNKTLLFPTIGIDCIMQFRGKREKDDSLLSFLLLFECSSHIRWSATRGKKTLIALPSNENYDNVMHIKANDRRSNRLTLFFPRLEL